MLTKHSYIQIDLKPALKFDGYTLCHVGKSTAHKKDYVPNHVHHVFYELTVVTAGKGVSFVGDIPTEVNKGDIFVSFPFEKHRIDSDPADFMSYSFICFDVTTPKFSGKLNQLWLDHIPPQNRIIHYSLAESLIDSVIDEINSGSKKYFNDLVSAILEQITINLLRGFADRMPVALPKSPTDAELCRHISHYIDSHIFTMKQLSECAAALSYNYCYLSTVFKKTTGISMSEYHRGKKLDMSKVLISEGEFSLSEIAEKLGYSGISAFSKAFSAKFKMSPREFSKKLHEVG